MSQDKNTSKNKENKKIKQDEFCGLLIINQNNEILMQLRDNKPNIAEPNKWGTFGGKIEPNETPKQAIIREIKEELDLDIKNPEFFKIFNGTTGKQHVFIMKVKKEPKIKILEGQKGEYISEKNLDNFDFGFNQKQLLKDYFKKCKH